MDFNRDRWGRPLVTPPGGGKPEPYGRFSVHGQCLEDRFALEKWKLRTAGIGLARRPDLFAQVAACPPEDSRRLDDLIGSALEAGGSSIGAGLGTALHEFTQRWDQGQLDITHVPEPWNADIAAYQAALEKHGLVIERDLIEVTLVHDELRLAGTSDRFYRRSDGRLVCADLKTGKSIGDNPLAYIVQLAAYATAVKYDVETGQRSEIGDVDLGTGLIIHLPSGKATCEVYEVDLATGLEAARVASVVRSWQKRKGTVRKVSEVAKSPSPAEKGPAAEPICTGEAAGPANPTRRAWVETRVRKVVDAGAAQLLVGKWPDGVPTLKQHNGHTEAELDKIVVALDSVEAAAGISFGPADPTLPVVTADDNKPKPAAKPAARQVIDEGRDVEQADLDALRRFIGAQPETVQVTLGRIVKEASGAKKPISLRQKPTERRFELARALIQLASFEENDMMRAIVNTVRPVPDGATVGSAVGDFTIAEAKHLYDTCHSINAGDTTVGFASDGSVTVNPTQPNKEQEQ